MATKIRENNCCRPSHDSNTITLKNKTLDAAGVVFRISLIQRYSTSPDFDNRIDESLPIMSTSSPERAYMVQIYADEILDDLLSPSLLRQDLCVH